MTRRAESPALPTVVHVEAGVLLIGPDPWFECGTCSAVFDTVAFASCPACDANAHPDRHDHLSILLREAHSARTTHRS